jgi:dihydroorotase
MILIENGTVVDPANGIDELKDLLVDGAAIRAADKPGSFRSSADIQQRIDAKGCWVVPGLVDLHVHLREPGFEWKETVATGVEAAVLGGYTSVCSMPNTNPTNDSAEVTRFILNQADKAGKARVFPIGAVSIGLKGKQLAPLSELFEAGCAAFSDDGEPIYDAGLMRRALEWCEMLGAVISCHEEDKALSCGGCMNESPLSYRLGLQGMPKVAEDVMVSRDIELARATGGRAHICHVSTARSVELIRRAKKDGIKITAEVTPHHLVLTEEAVREYDTYSKMSPPLREEEDVAALIQGLVDGTIDAIASDHAPHEDDSKKVEFARASFGILGLQTSLPLLLNFVEKGTISRARAISVMSHLPAAIFNLPGGRLSAGAVADITVIDPKKEWLFTPEEVRSKSRNSPFYNRKLTGRAREVLVGGKIVVSNFSLNGEVK